jgi:HTH-type transcriptional regulator, transcriptional repressor of NAD biosynthesis genes
VKRFGRGVVFGKFWPLHAGHLELIGASIEACGQVVVVVDDGPEDVSASTRTAWVQESFPTAHVMSAPDLCGHDSPDCTVRCSERYAAWLVAAFGSVDAVFSGEPYGETLAACLGAISVPWPRPDPRISGRCIRADLVGHWDLLSPPARAWYCRRLVIVGAESTGTTTLARGLADALKTVWVPEYGRQFTLEHGLDHVWESDDFDLIARHQAVMEDTAARFSGPVLICDTDVLATAIWHERYVGTSRALVATMATERRPALYILTSDDIPFVQDGLRDGEHVRGWMTERFRTVLLETGVPWCEVRGNPETRLSQAHAAIAKTIGPQWMRHGPRDVIA